MKRLSLLESTPAERSYTLLGFPITQFPSLFRTEPLPDSRSLAASAPTFTPQFGAPPNLYAQSPPGAIKPPPARVAAPTPSSGVPVRPASVTQQSSGTYATVGGIESGITQFSIAPVKAQAAKKAVLLNANDQRLDEKLPKPDASSVFNLNRRIRESKVCNSFHLLGRCPNDKHCPYAHGDRLNPKEQLALRTKARERSCPMRSDCRDIDCFFGHQCPRDDNCTFGDCYFDDLHDLDPHVAMKMYADGQIVILDERVQR